MLKEDAPNVSVVICTYNGADLLPGLIERLRSQQTSCRWELIIVNNNSCDRTADVIDNMRANWRSDVPLRPCFEPQQGLAFARRRAVCEATGELIGFLDDDTLPDDNWVEEVFRFGQQHPEVGAYGSSIRGIYETPPPTEFQRIACCLAIIDRGDTPFQYPRQRGVLPAGAGMVIRRRAWLEQVPTVPALEGVSANSLKAKGEDVETLSYIRKAWPVWHNPAMRIGHIVPQSRLERAYLLNLFWQIGLSRYPLRRLQHRRWLWPAMSMLYLASDLKKAIGYLLTANASTSASEGASEGAARGKASIGAWLKGLAGRRSVRLREALVSGFDTVEACELSLLIGSLISPFARRRWPSGQSSGQPSGQSSAATYKMSLLSSKPH